MRRYDFSKLIVPGLEDGTAIISGERDVGGNISWDAGAHTDFTLDIGSPRYQACVQEARKLKALYPLDHLDPAKPADRQEIAKREEAIVVPLIEKLHEEYGYFNPLVETAQDCIDHPSLHRDVERAYRKKPVNLGNFEKEELVCRHFGPLASALSTEAGIPVIRVCGYTHDFTANDGKIALDEGDAYSALPPTHNYVVSRLTGNVIDAASTYNSPYKPNINHLSVNDLIAGRTIITADNQTDFTTYGTGYAGTTRQDAAIASRGKKLARGLLRNRPWYDRQSGFSEAALAVYDLGIVREEYHRLYPEHAAKKPYGPRTQLDSLRARSSMATTDAKSRH